MTDDRLSPSQAAAYIEREWHLRVHPDTVRRWVTKGGLPTTRDPRGRVLIDPAELHTILDCSGQREREQSEASVVVNVNGSVDR